MNMIRNGSIYTGTARFDGTARALTEDELYKLAPSIFAVDAHESRSARFRPIPTIEVLRGLAEEGFVAVGARQSTARDEGKALHTKHLIRLRRIDADAKYTVGGTTLEMLLKNANDGTSAYDLMAGMFRIICANSLVAQTSTVDAVKVRHSGEVTGKVIEGTYRVLESATTLLEAPERWSALKLEREEALAFAEAAHVLRFGDADGNVKTPVKPLALLAPRRREDTEPNLYNVFNVVQENVIKGGLRDWIRDEQGRRIRRTTTREVKGIDQDVKLNKALWVLTEKMAELRGVKLAA